MCRVCGVCVCVVCGVYVWCGDPHQTLGVRPAEIQGVRLSRAEWDQASGQKERHTLRWVLAVSAAGDISTAGW